jgi:adenine-specific DNA-methyltransferase
VSLEVPSHASEDLHAAARQIAASYRRAETVSAMRRLEICSELLGGRYPPHLSNDTAVYLASLLRAERHYVIGAVYALLMSQKRRKRLSAYFTPPHISSHIVSQMVTLGLNLEVDSVVDPACGGAAFLVPLAGRMGADHAVGTEAAGVGQILRRLAGFEIEPGLATLSETLIADALGVAPELVLGRVVRRGNALKSGALGLPPFDAVITNPPYGRVYKAKRSTTDTWSKVITDGHVNTYALFVALSINIVREGGLIALLIPTSFIGGPYFSRLRSAIRAETNLIQIELIQERSEAFLDVVQDTCILYLRRRKAGEVLVPQAPNVYSFDAKRGRTLQGVLQMSPLEDGVWALPNSDGGGGPELSFFDSRFADLSAYGYTARSGYFVWNRNQDKLADRELAAPGELPLVWAKNVKADQAVQVGTRENRTPGSVWSFVQVSPDSPAVIRQPAVVIQRTTNKSQVRRLVVGHVPQEVIDRFGGYVTENHTIVVQPEPLSEQKLSTELMRRLLSSSAVDEMYRKVSGTASVSTKLIRYLPLPNPDKLAEAMGIQPDFELAVRQAYVLTLSD